MFNIDSSMHSVQDLMYKIVPSFLCKNVLPYKTFGKHWKTNVYGNKEST